MEKCFPHKTKTNFHGRDVVKDTGVRKFEASRTSPVAGIVHRRQYVAGEYVFFQNDPGFGMYVVEQGEVSVILLGANGTKKELAVLKDGDFFGELSLLDESPRRRRSSL